MLLDFGKHGKTTRGNLDFIQCGGIYVDTLIMSNSIYTWVACQQIYIAIDREKTIIRFN